MAETRTANGDFVEEKSGGCDVCCVKPWTKEGFLGLGQYNYKEMCCTFGLPFCMKEVAPPTFFSKDEKLPLIFSLFLGLQHCLAMLVGIATSGGRLIANDTCFSWQKDSEMCSRMPWMISVAWITSGILTAIQVFRVKILGTKYFLGTGLISVMGTSFTFLPIARTMTLEAISDARGNACAEDPLNGNATIFTGECCEGGFGDCKGAGAIGYGRFLGTCLVACLLEVVISLLPAWLIKKLFPPVVTGSVIMLIGGGLIGAGIKYVGGGVFCGENTESKFIGSVGNFAFNFAPAGPGTSHMPHICDENGEVQLSFGSPEYVGLAFACIFFSIILQIFGSPFFKSTFIFWSLAFGCICASGGKEITKTVTTVITEASSGVEEETTTTTTTETLSYFDSGTTPIDAADDITFLWAKGTFSIGFSGVYFFPILIGFFISTAETVGDVSMTCLYSGIDPDSAEASSRVQGGLLADGVNSFLACLFGSPPNTTFSQNNGLIALTRCASRSAGFSCSFWLILLGVFGKFGYLFASIPICVVGGVVLQMFSSVFVSGMKVATSDFTRRNQFILTLGLGLGLGVAMEGHVFDWPGPYSFMRRNLAYDYGFWPEKKVCETPNAPWIDDDGLCHNVGFFGIHNGNCCASYDKNKKGVRSAILMMLKTPYCIGFLVVFILNLIIPEDKDDGQGSDEPTIGPGATKEGAVTATSTA